jgi:hypothetical protein
MHGNCGQLYAVAQAVVSIEIGNLVGARDRIAATDPAEIDLAYRCSGSSLPNAGPPCACAATAKRAGKANPIAPIQEMRSPHELYRESSVLVEKRETNLARRKTATGLALSRLILFGLFGKMPDFRFSSRIKSLSQLGAGKTLRRLGAYHPSHPNICAERLPSATVGADGLRMRSLVSYARSTFWTLGVVYILLGLIFGCTEVIRHPAAGHHKAGIVIILIIGLLPIALGALSCLAAAAFRHKGRFSKPLVAINCFLSLALFPFGTIAGAAGLYWCFSPKMREAEPLVESFEHQSKPGDGTHQWLQKAVPVVAIVIWIGSFACASLWGRAHGLRARGPINGLPLLFLCEWIAVFFHELGHAVAGWASDMQLARFVVGPFLAQRRAGRWKLQFSLTGILNSGGSVATVPLHLHRLRQRMAFEVAGGPVASLLTALAAFVVLLAMPGSAYAAWWKVPAVVGAISAGAAVLNLIPFGFAAGVSDGALLVQLFRGGSFADLRESLKMVGSTAVTSARPRDLDSRTLAHGLRAGAGTPEEGMLQMIQLICAVDRGEFVQAREHLGASLLRMPAPEKAPTAGTAAEMAFYMAYLDGDAARAGNWLRGAEQLATARNSPLTGDSDYWRAMTAVREAEGQNRQAEEAYHRAMQLLEKKPAAGLYQFEREFLQTVRKGEWVRRQDGALSEAAV